ncbi:MAG: hypothetical protein ABI561_07985, partial [Bradyrhizobium sp.]
MATFPLARRRGQPDNAWRWTHLLTTTVAVSLAVCPMRMAQAANITTTTPGENGATAVTTAPQQSAYAPSGHDAVGQGGCNYQYTDKLNSLAQGASTNNIIGQTANAASWGTAIATTNLWGGEFDAAAAGLGVGSGGLGTMAGGLGDAAAGVFLGAPLLATPLDAGPAIPGFLDEAAGHIVSASGAGVASGGLADAATALATAGGTSTAAGVALGLQTVGVATGVAGAVLQQEQTSLAAYVSYLPNCDLHFSGTVFTDANIIGGQGIAAVNGAINLGNPDGVTYQPGITLGGGALSGAGSSGPATMAGPLATTDNVNAIAIGNGASASNGASTALGLGTTASGLESTAIGNGATASGDHSTAIGSNATASGLQSTAIGYNTVAAGDNSFAAGSGSKALADSTVAIGFGALVAAAAGAGSFAGGTSSVLSGTGAVSIGNLNVASGNGAVASGDPNTAP